MHFITRLDLSTSKVNKLLINLISAAANSLSKSFTWSINLRKAVLLVGMTLIEKNVKKMFIVGLVHLKCLFLISELFAELVRQKNSENFRFQRWVKLSMLKFKLARVIILNEFQTKQK